MTTRPPLRFVGPRASRRLMEVLRHPNEADEPFRGGDALHLDDALQRRLEAVEDLVDIIGSLVQMREIALRRGETDKAAQDAQDAREQADELVKWAKLVRTTVEAITNTQQGGNDEEQG